MGPCQSRRRRRWEALQGRPAAAAAGGGSGGDAGRLTLQKYCEVLRGQSRGDAGIVGGSEALFPMFAVSVPEFLRMTEAKPHQVLKQEGLVQQYSPTMGAAAFVSHQWCARGHPDPNFAQLAVLQGFVRNAVQGEVQLQADLFSIAVYKLKLSVKARHLMELRDGYVWYDYFSVPQPAAPVASSVQYLNMEGDFGKAVMSIPAYVEMSKYFIILAPPVAHADNSKTHIVDYATWKQRGWCRLERAARIMSPKETTLLLVVRDNIAYQVGAQDYFLDSVGDGMFTVESDKAMLAPIVQSLVRNKLHALLQQRDLHRYRRVLAVRTALLRGLPLSVDECCAPGFPVEGQNRCELDAFLHLYGFSSATERSVRSEPILFAATGGDLPAIRGLLERRACISACEARHEPELMVTKGASVLHLAGIFARIPALIRPLVELRADLEAKDRGSCARPLHWAAAGGCADCVDALLDAGADINATDAFGLNVLDVAAQFGRREIVVRLLARGVPPTVNADSMYPLAWATLFPTGADVIQAVLASRADPNIPAAPRLSSQVFMVMFALSLPYRLRGSRLPLALVGYHLHGATPLGIAAVLGHVAEARALVAGGADPMSRNSRGKTPAQLAELAGLSPDNVASFRGPAAESWKDLPEEALSKVVVHEVCAKRADDGTAVDDILVHGEIDDFIN